MVVHQGIDGSRFRLDGALPLDGGPTSTADIITGQGMYQLHSGPPGLADDFVRAARVDGFDEEFAYEGATLRVGRRKIFDEKVFPAARKAYAEGYDIYTGPCPSYAEDHNCSPGCGPSTVFADACETSGPHTGFHRDDGRDWILQPNNCYPGGDDGWLWFYNGACGACACHIERRCHDGYRRTDNGWVSSICRWDTQCGCPPAPPPPPEQSAPPRVGQWPTVPPGAQGSDVYTFQHLLNHRANPAPTHGRFGPLTEASVRTFQATHFIAPSGAVDPVTWLALIVPVRRGDFGQQVYAVQHQLSANGLHVGFTGRFDAAAENATRTFQRRKGLPVSGVVDESTWRELVAG